MEGQRKVEKSKQFVSFYIAGELYALDVMKITGIEKPRKLREIPGAPDFIIGIMDVRGHMVPIIDMRKKLRVDGEKQQGKERRIILVEIGKRMIGLEVDDVKEVFQVDSDKIEDVPVELSWEIDTRYMIGVTRIEDKLVIILDPEMVCTEEEKKSLEKIGKLGI